MLIMIVIDSPIGSIGSKNVYTPGYPLGPLVFRCTVQWWPMYRVNMCCTSVVTNAGGVCKIMLAVTGDHHAVLANIIG